MFNDLRHERARILIVDDMASNIHVIREAVRDLGEVRFATSGREALEMAQRAVPDVILLDIEMPGMDGYAVCREIKATPRLSDIPVIFVTSHDEDGHELQALNIGGVDFLHKPLNVPVARARVQTQLALRLRTRQLGAAQRDLAEVLRRLPAFVAYWNADLCNEFANDESGAWFGIAAADMRGLPARAVLGEANFLAMELRLRAALNGDAATFDLSLAKPDGGTLHGQVALAHRPQEGGRPGCLMLIADVTERKRAELALRDEKERIRITLNSIGDAVIATDAAGRVTFLNPIAEEMTGWLAKEALGQPIESVMPLQASDAGRGVDNPVRLVLAERRAVGMTLDRALLRRDGRLLEVEDSAAPILDHAGELTGAIIVFHNVGEARALAVKMMHLAQHDALTNLPNRMLLQDRTQQALRQAESSGERLGLFILDLDHFKVINDSVGHSVGDRLLQLVAKRLQAIVRPGDTISRQGGDEFIILMPDPVSIEQLGAVAARLQKAVSEPCLLDEERFDLSVSIGVSLYPDDSRDQEELYRHADAAMYQAKEDGRNRYRFFSAEIEEALLSRQALERHIRMGAESGGFRAYYQAKVDVTEGRIVGVEALMRWRDESGEIISPGHFIPLAEETGLILPLGRFILRQACLDGKRWHDAGLPLRIAVNVSAAQIADGCFSDTVRAVLAETGIAPQLLELEITEGVLAANIAQTMSVLAELKRLGVAIAVDDFGTGYSNLAYLRQFPIDVLKIDQSFVRDMIGDKSNLAIISAIVSMARGLDLQLVAEGVESAEQERALLALGCRVMQGFLYGRPVPAEEMDRQLGNGARLAGSQA